LPLALVALLVALTPLSLLAAGPFNDLTGGVHDANIGLIYDAGITKGCVPNVAYCPTANVTREEMASFLARTAGLGTNPPVVNAKTAQTATLATTAGHAGSADTATSATTAQDAATLGGYAPAALTRLAFSGDPPVATLPNTAEYTDIVRVTLTVPGPAAQAVSVRGAFGAYNQPSGGFIATTIRQDGAANTIGTGRLYLPYQTTASVTGISPYAEWTFVAPPGAHTLVAQAGGTAGNLSVNQVRLVATTHPFGATGGPGATAPAADPAPGRTP